MIVFVFILFNSCCINLNYEWNSLLKKIFFILLQHRNIFDFFVIKEHFYYHKTNLIFYKPKKKKKHFLVLKKTDLIFYKSKDFILCNKHISEFLFPKTTFLFYFIFF